MRIEVSQGLPLVSAVLFHQGKSIEIDRVLLDTGSAGIVLSADLFLTRILT